MQALRAISTIDLITSLENPPPPSRRPKVYRDRTDPFTLPEEEFRRRYRFTKETMRFIVNLVQRDLKTDKRGCGTSPEL